MEFKSFDVLGVPVACTTMPEAIEQVNEWVAQSEEPRLICFTNVHMVIEANTNPSFRNAMSRMDMNFPDGAPIYWMGRHLCGDAVEKVSGPQFMPLFCEQSVALGHKHYLFGGGPGVAEDAGKALRKSYPGIQIVGHESPPFDGTTPEQTAEMIARINQSGAQVLWVCLGCPKQEQWMTDHRHLLTVKVMLAVGQAFDILAGRTKRAPEFISDLGLEWAFRLANEPKRLAKRYIVTNSVFLWLLFLDLFPSRSYDELPRTLPQPRRHIG